jgi:hypothetical protein
VDQFQAAELDHFQAAGSNICSTGTKLTASCDPCATKICAADSYCCQTKWDSQCTGEVSSICNQSCE